jgi:hypothetical protein
MQSRRCSLEIRNLDVGGFRGWLRPPYMSFSDLKDELHEEGDTPS